MERPPFQLTPKILSLAGAIQEVIGELKPFSAVAPLANLRRENKIQTVHHAKPKIVFMRKLGKAIGTKGIEISEKKGS
ncbi:MAG: hypothetical protein COT73_06940 [Bdellovibrio sp. CG10_big_fil_rev_8_21_14_0_10_47_8]|nr:MAG: hypothetical protein COT73_06940 [Bdellovibrio sp. CG10_big_fil_rev_8_21_14_0_10_47_8]